MRYREVIQFTAMRVSSCLKQPRGRQLEQCERGTCVTGKLLFHTIVTLHTQKDADTSQPCSVINGENQQFLDGGWAINATDSGNFFGKMRF